MLRSLLTLLALLVTGLAVLFDRPWLYVVTGLIVVGSLGLLGWWLWTTYWSEEPDRSRPPPVPENSEASLEELGIVDIQPKDASRDEPGDAPVEGDAADHDQTSPATNAGAATPSTGSFSPSSPDKTAASVATASESVQRPAAARDAPVLAPLLESVRAAIDARTVCLLVQEDVALTYRIEALASTHPSVRHSGPFDTQTPLLTATMSGQSVTVRPLAQEKIAIEDLRYYEAPPAVDHLATAPVSRPDASSTTFLLADAPAKADLGSSRARTLLGHFAETVALLLSTARTGPNQDPTESRPEPANESSSHESSDEAVNGAAPEEDAPRPRREIIAEEMEAAQAASEDLALALVHLNRAESIARRGEEAVASAERLFRARLEQRAPNQRVERFGELTYGIFFRTGADPVEAWVADLETSMAAEDGELEGGVSVGVAVWGGRTEDPEALRAEATEALREAYETGTPTIVT